MVHQSKARVVVLALTLVGCVASDDGATEQARATEDGAPALRVDEADEPATPQALVTQADVSSADEGSRSRGGSRAPVASQGDDKPRAPEGPSPGRAWDAASVGFFCSRLDRRLEFLCRVTLADCRDPARSDLFTQILCELRGFATGTSTSSGGSNRPLPVSEPSTSDDSGL